MVKRASSLVGTHVSWRRTSLFTFAQRVACDWSMRWWLKPSRNGWKEPAISTQSLVCGQLRCLRSRCYDSSAGNRLGTRVSASPIFKSTRVRNGPVTPPLFATTWRVSCRSGTTPNRQRCQRDWRCVKTLEKIVSDRHVAIVRITIAGSLELFPYFPGGKSGSKRGGSSVFRILSAIRATGH